MATVAASRRTTLLVLDYGQHEGARWNAAVFEALRRRLPAGALVVRDAHSLSWTVGFGVPSSGGPAALANQTDGGGVIDLTSVALVLNRISDAQAPELAKRAHSFLAHCAAMGVRTLNGAAGFGLATGAGDAGCAGGYAVACSKALQGSLLVRAGLQTPPTVIVAEPPEAGVEIGAATRRFREELSGACEAVGWPVLLKPNAGGFGKGIRLLRTPVELAELFPVAAAPGEAVADTGVAQWARVSSDGMLLVQHYFAAEYFVRAFHCARGRRILAAVRRAPTLEPDGEVGSFNTCVCREAAAWEPYELSADEEAEIRRVAECCAQDLGSVEFLVVPAPGPEGGVATTSRLYFDINFLSTFPTSAEEALAVWIAEEYEGARAA